MTIYRRKRLYIFCALMICILSLSIGFAAFSTTLNISSTASVTPNSSDFNIGFYYSTTETLADWAGGVESPSISIGHFATPGTFSIVNSRKGISIENMGFAEPGDILMYSLYLGNAGEYDAFLRSVEFLNTSGGSSSISCTPGAGATASLVAAACESISMEVEIGDDVYSTTTTNISNKALPKGTYEDVTITFSYDKDGARADGPFTVDFGGIEIDYSTVDGEARVINFIYSSGGMAVINLSCEEGMSWLDWVGSEYNKLVLM